MICPPPSEHEGLPEDVQHEPHLLRESAAARRCSSTDAPGEAGRMPRSTRHRTPRRFENRRLSSPSSAMPPSSLP
ncbi:Os08g0518150, partial [Oryza sativa Japonica Group]